MKKTVNIIILFVLVLILFAGTVNAEITDGLLAYYPFDGDANDAVGAHHGTTVNGITFIEGHIGQAASFDGIDDFIIFDKLLDSENGDQEYSIFFWAKVPSGNGNTRFISQYTGGVHRWGLHPDNYKGRLSYSKFGEPGTTIGTTSITDDEWHFLGFTKGTGDNNVKVYVDGDLEKTGTDNNPFVNANTRMGHSRLNGEMDEVGIWNRVLTPDEIAFLANGGVPVAEDDVADDATPVGGLVAHYPLDGNARDAVGTYHGRTKGTVTSVEGHIGQAAHFDGSSSIAIGNVDNGNVLNMGDSQDFSISIWTKLASGNRRGLVTKKPGTGVRNAGYLLSRSGANGAAGFWISDGTHYLSALGTTSLSDNNWHHVVVTVDRDDSVRLYTDGNLEDSGPVNSVGNIDTAVPLVIAAENGGLSLNAIGDIDDVRIYTRALSAADVIALYESGGEDVGAPVDDQGDYDNPDYDNPPPAREGCANVNDCANIGGQLAENALTVNQCMDIRGRLAEGGFIVDEKGYFDELQIGRGDNEGSLDIYGRLNMDGDLGVLGNMIANNALFFDGLEVDEQVRIGQYGSGGLYVERGGVGIGTAPDNTYRLKVKGNSNTYVAVATEGGYAGFSMLDSNNNVKAKVTAHPDPNEGLYFFVDQAGGTPDMSLSDEGNLKIQGVFESGGEDFIIRL